LNSESGASGVVPLTASTIYRLDPILVVVSPRCGQRKISLHRLAVEGSAVALGWIAKGVEIALIGVVAVNLIGAYGSAGGVVRAALGSLQLERRTS
jgi:hypothetical protein